MKTMKELLRPRTEEEVQRAVRRFVADVRRHYGDRLIGLYLTGSRARGDHHPHSDVDVAVVLKDGDWRSWDESGVLSDLSYDRLIKEGVDIQAVPIPASHWEEPSRHSNPSLRVVSSLWDLVEDAAAEARDLMRLRRYRGVVSRGYYAVFSAARALLVEHAGFEEGDIRRHAAVHKLFSEHLVEPGLMPVDLGSGLRRIPTKRANADYQSPGIEEGQAAEALAFMEQFPDAAARVRRTPRP